MKQWILPLLLLMACTADEYLSEQELGRYVLDEDHGLIKTEEANGLKLQVYYKPTGLLVAQELNGVQDTAQYRRLHEKYENYAYFMLDLSSNDQNALYQSGSYSNFSENLQTLAFRMDQFANLTTSNQDTIPVGDFIYPRLYGMSNTASVMFVFNNKKLLDADWVSFNLSEFGMGSGNQQFKFRVSDFKKTPKLKL